MMYSDVLLPKQTVLILILYFLYLFFPKLSESISFADSGQESKLNNADSSL